MSFPPDSRLPAGERSNLVALSVLVVAMLLAPAAQGNETDPWYPWVHPPRDGTVALNRAVGDRMARGLRWANASRDPPGLECRDIALRMTTPMRTAAFFFFVSDLSLWTVPYSPRSSSEYVDSLSRYGGYRYIYGLLPLDPSMRAGPVLFGTDKIGHFFTNGLRQYDAYRAIRAAGGSEDAALRKAIDEGIAEENSWLGKRSSGIFSFADLEANHQGLMFFRALCEQGELKVIDGKWTLTKPFDIARWVSPCWDEAFNPSYFYRAPEEARRGLAEMCEQLDVEDARARRAQYRAMECTSASSRVVREMVARQELPDPTPWAYQSVCASAERPMPVRD